MLYTYLHINESGVFYAGCGNNKRPYRNSSRSREWLRTANGGYSILIIDMFEDRELAWKHEKELIAYFKPACNKASGGPGPSGIRYEKTLPMKTKRTSPEALARLSKSRMGEGNPNYGLRHTSKSKIKMSKPGTLNPRCKLTEAQIIQIRSEPGTLKQISEKYKISPPHASLIRSKKLWGHIA